jgi:5'-nucleotidase / UDP-sugar diphosphatase
MGVPGTLADAQFAVAEGNGMKKTFAILQTNELNNLIGIASASDYARKALNEDRTRGGFVRLATPIATKRAARADQGAVLLP